MLPTWIKLTHRWMECAVSFVAGVMLGVAVLHLLPHALSTIAAARAEGSPHQFVPASLWILAGFLAMFFVERFFCFHHHDVPHEVHSDTKTTVEGLSEADSAHHSQAASTSERSPTSAESFTCSDHDHAHSDHAHDITWSGATLGLTLHSVMAGIALAASTGHPMPSESALAGIALPGFGTFLAILLHKPFDSMTIAMLMNKGGWSAATCSIVNALFALAIPAGVLLAHWGGFSAHSVAAEGDSSVAVAYALAFSTGVFLCISMSDLLPELQFHHHDRGKLSASLLLGLLLAYGASRLETHSHSVVEPDTQKEMIAE